jgi:hypothetical protein
MTKKNPPRDLGPVKDAHNNARKRTKTIGRMEGETV